MFLSHKNSKNKRKQKINPKLHLMLEVTSETKRGVGCEEDPTRPSDLSEVGCGTQPSDGGFRLCSSRPICFNLPRSARYRVCRARHHLSGLMLPGRRNCDAYHTFFNIHDIVANVALSQCAFSMKQEVDGLQRP